MRKYACILAAGAMSFGACADEGTTADNGLTGPKLDLNIAALTLDGVEDAVWDLRVTNDEGDDVWSARITADQYGDGSASASYIGTCDAQDNDSNGSAINTVHVDLIGIYAATVSDPGDFGDQDKPTDTALPLVNPDHMTQEVECEENADAFVQFDVAIMRPANQGFFDIAVNFNDIYCSAKYDCGAGNLLHDGNGTRSLTHVLGFACTAGTDAGVQTKLLLDDNVSVVCDGVTVGTIKTADSDGNVCGRAGSNDGQFEAQDCDNSVVESPLFQAAVYKGAEDLNGLSKFYYNVALGFDDNLTGADCSLSFRATADDGAAPALPGNRIDDGQVYPYINFDVADLDSCDDNNPVNSDDNVSTRYTSTTGNGFTFGAQYPAAQQN